MTRMDPVATAATAPGVNHLRAAEARPKRGPAPEGETAPRRGPGAVRNATRPVGRADRIGQTIGRCPKRSYTTIEGRAGALGLGVAIIVL